MTEKTHLTIGFCTGIIISSIIQAPIDQFVAGCLVGSDIADVDQCIKFIRHRGITHSLLIPAMAFILNWYYPSWVILGFIIGLLTHIAADLLNGKGVELFAPLSKKNYRLMDIKYDGEGEAIIRILTVVGVVFYFGYNYLHTY